MLLVFLVLFLPPPPKNKKIFERFDTEGGKRKKGTHWEALGVFRETVLAKGLSFGLRGVFGVSSHHPGSARLHLWAQAWTGIHIITAAVTSLRGDSYLSRRQNFISRPASTRPYSIPSHPHPPLSPHLRNSPPPLSFSCCRLHPRQALIPPFYPRFASAREVTQP